MRGKVLKMLWFVLGLVAAVALFIFWSVGARSGALVTGDRLERAKQSPQWSAKGRRFSNRQSEFRGSFFEMTRKYFFGGSKVELLKVMGV